MLRLTEADMHIIRRILVDDFGTTEDKAKAAVQAWYTDNIYMLSPTLRDFAHDVWNTEEYWR